MALCLLHFVPGWLTKSMLQWNGPLTASNSVLSSAPSKIQLRLQRLHSACVSLSFFLPSFLPFPSLPFYFLSFPSFRLFVAGVGERCADFVPGALLCESTTTTTATTATATATATATTTPTRTTK